MENTNPDVSVIIVNYNTKELTQNCIESVIEKTKKISYEIILVDNASIDGSVESIKNKQYKNTRIIINKKNIGFGRANNRGAKKSKGKYLFLLNSDTLLVNDAISIFFQTAEKNKRDYIYGCYLQDLEGNYINSYSNFQDRIHLAVRSLYLFFPWLQGKRRKVTNSRLRPVEKNVDFISGADLFIKRTDFIKLEGFDPNFFMYCEDEDLCLRAKSNGILCHILTKPKIIHLEGKSSKVSSAKRKMILTSYRYFTKKNLR